MEIETEGGKDNQESAYYLPKTVCSIITVVPEIRKGKGKEK